MTAIDDLRQSVADLQSAETAENTELAAIASSLQVAEQQLSALQSQVSSGAGVSEADLEQLASSINQVATSAQAATASAAAAPAAPAGSPVGPTPTAPTGTPDTTGTAPAPAPAPAPDPGTGTAPAPAPAPTTERSVYTFDGDPSTVDPTVWPTAPVVTSDGRALYYYSGDTAVGDANGDGVGGVWHLYTGPTQAAGAPAAGPEAQTGPGPVAEGEEFPVVERPES